LSGVNKRDQSKERNEINMLKNYIVFGCNT
jgi:hypothetical protein